MKKMFLTAIMAICVVAGFSQSAQPAQGSENRVREKDQQDLPNGIERNKTYDRNPIVRAYPNPTNGSITIEGFVVNACSKYQVCSITGQIILTGTVNVQNTMVDLSGLLNGMYLITFTGDHEPVTVRLVKQ